MSDKDLSDEEILKVCIREKKKANQLESLIPKIHSELERDERYILKKMIEENKNCTNKEMVIWSKIMSKERKSLKDLRKKLKEKNISFFPCKTYII